ncbi:hypothetical protein [uncultured Desulfuromusa sp.]|uniref:hypothetical protein n=1 Tax=uncultured Desulfuromusa sp. TaxID=219183 RepID=UPI002AA6C463|nr:hypothetical protein [uncultured Desulfuromusa sp.]
MSKLHTPIGDGLEGKIGVWEGAGEQGTNEYYPELATWTIMITLTEEEQTIEYALISDPSDPCGGTLSLIEESDAQLTFRERQSHIRALIMAASIRGLLN